MSWKQYGGRLVLSQEGHNHSADPIAGSSRTRTKYYSSMPRRSRRKDRTSKLLVSPNLPFHSYRWTTETPPKCLQFNLLAMMMVPWLTCLLHTEIQLVVALTPRSQTTSTTITNHRPWAAPSSNKKHSGIITMLNCQFNNSRTHSMLAVARLET